MDIILNEELEKLALKIDTEVKAFVEKNSDKYFKNPPKEDWYKSVKHDPSKEGYQGTLRTKVTIGEEKCSFKCWDADKNR